MNGYRKFDSSSLWWFIVLLCLASLDECAHIQKLETRMNQLTGQPGVAP